MPSGDLGTTNLLLGILAAVSVLEALAILVVGVIGIGRGVRAALESVLTAESWRRATTEPGR